MKKISLKSLLRNLFHFIFYKGMIEMNASHISRELYDWIQKKEQYGKVHSIFKSTINILSEDGRFIPIVIKSKPMSPNSIKLREDLNFMDLDISIDERVRFTKLSMEFLNLSINYSKALKWNKELKLDLKVDTYKNYKLKLNIIKEFLAENGNKDGIYNLIGYISEDFPLNEGVNLDNKAELFIKDRFLNFINAFENHDIDKINLLSKKIIGYGQGLTPSMDDFISGLMISNIYTSYLLGLNMENPYKINKEIIKDQENRTTRVSEEMLKQASLGEANEDIRNLMMALIGISSKENLVNLLEKVIDYGHSSGTDILFGIYIGSSILDRNFYK